MQMEILNQLPKILMNWRTQKSVGYNNLNTKGIPSPNQNPRWIGLNEVWKFVHLLSDDFVLPKTQTLLPKEEKQ